MVNSSDQQWRKSSSFKQVTAVFSEFQSHIGNIILQDYYDPYPDIFQDLKDYSNIQLMKNIPGQKAFQISMGKYFFLIKLESNQIMYLFYF